LFAFQPLPCLPCSYVDTGVLSVTLLKRVALSVHGLPSKPHSQPPHAELLAEQAQGGLVVATEVVGSVGLPPPSAANNSGEERTVAEAAISQVVSEPQVGATSSGGDIVMVFADQVFADQTVPPPLPTRVHEAAAPASSEIPVPVTTLVGGGVTEASVFGAWSTINFEVINLDATELPSNYRDIYVAVLEHMLVDPVESEIEVPKAATSAAATSADVAASASGEPVPGATAAR
jgi:hypothetical protein